jgi:hypothetical protein
LPHQSFSDLSTEFTRAAANAFILANAGNIQRAIHAVFVTFPQPTPLYFHSIGKLPAINFMLKFQKPL